MGSREFLKSEKKILRRLSTEAYARELDLALRDLDSAFSDWRRKHIDGFQLSEFIHDFHQGISRDLYSQYAKIDPGFLVARAVARRLLEPAEVPEKLLAALQPLITYCAEAAEDPDK